MYTRRNQRNLTSSQRQRFVEAVVELKRTGAYEKYVTTHAQYFAADGETGQRVAHMAPSFFPWHRYFVLLFERDLQLLDSKITVPYWDWTVDRGKNAALWGPDFMGGDGRDSDGQVMTGPFAYRSGHWTITNGVTTERYLTRNMGRPSQPIALPTAAELDGALRTAVYDTAPWNSAPSTQGFRNKMEGWTVSPAKGGYLHNRVHQWVGGHMVSGTSPNDPVFWLHHSFMDLIWVRWQRRHPSSRYQPQRPLAGRDPEHGRVISSDEPMPPWGVRPSQIMDHRRFYTYE
ncbi:tyrosinase family protein [Actinacidiphila acididurans]|uniref:Tyrosinase family protein n=1 Tax=Actinacidiphila acididurans TaxID=2784346 RepID=A0ABS2TSI9_9ACTN|nr:tyrosinase family protein [Actinacidiphila acididurans]MBM9505792.1 tyrosinase family protein [Actinacidiphila acididurans]